jgi:hypothetical protein
MRCCDARDVVEASPPDTNSRYSPRLVKTAPARTAELPRTSKNDLVRLRPAWEALIYVNRGATSPISLYETARPLRTGRKLEYGICPVKVGRLLAVWREAARIKISVGAPKPAE